jgi:hypothetical protein
MGMSKITYNGFTFPDRSKFSVSEEYVYDDAGMAITYTKFKLRVETIIVNPEGSLNYDPETSSSFFAGPEVERIRNTLSKSGRELTIEHDGYGERPHLSIGGGSSYARQDVAMGPKPRVLSWLPIGHTTSVEVVWECEYHIPSCYNARFIGLAAYNYGVSFDYDRRGYTTRRITGYIEIALTKVGSKILDSVDEYRDEVIIPKPANFHREVSWNVSLDKRRADFTVVDSEIPSQNIYPNGVVAIRARHRAGWSRRDRAKIPNTISATIELAATEQRVRAWLIFRDIVNARLKYAENLQRPTFIETFEVDEELFENQISFSLSYYILSKTAIAEIFASTGIMQPLEDSNRTWEDWENSVAKLHPLTGKGEDRGLAKLRHKFEDDRIVNLCSIDSPFATPEVVERPEPTPYPNQVYCNRRPPPEYSWLHFEGHLEYVEYRSSYTSTTLGPDDLQQEEYNPNKPDDYLEQTQRLERFIESYGSGSEFRWKGYAERIGYPIPKPGKLRIGNYVLKPTGKGKFANKFLGNHFCQPKYGASWNMTYKVQYVPPRTGAKDADPINVPDESENAA